MSEQNIPEVKDEVLDQVAGGGCTWNESFIIIARLTEAYEGLVDFTSHMIERVSTSLK
jgi:hypothetical protein